MTMEPRGMAGTKAPARGGRPVHLDEGQLVDEGESDHRYEADDPFLELSIGVREQHEEAEDGRPGVRRA